MCAAGGGGTHHGYRLRRIVSATTMRAGYPALIGSEWGSGEKQHEATATLGFQTSKPVSISATVNINPVAKITGSTGPDGGIPDDFERDWPNQVNGIWDYGSALTRLQGATGYEGNVSHALLEIPQGATTPPIDTVVVADTICGRLFGC